MKRALVVIGGLALLVAALWSGLWFWARGQVEAEIDARLAALAEEQALEIAYEGRETGGFPFALETRLTGVTAAKAEWGAELQVPEIVSRAELFEPSAITTRLPPEMQLVFSGPAADPAAEGWQFAVDIISEGMELRQGSSDGGAGETVLTAESLVIVPAAPDPARNAGIGFFGLEIRAITPASGPVSTEATIRETELSVTFPAMGGTRAANAVWLLDGAELTMQGRLRDEVDAQMLINGVGRLVAGLAAGRSVVEITVAGATAAESGRLSIVQSRVEGSLEIDGGRLALAGSARETAVTREPAAPEGKVRGTLTIPEAKGRLSLPVAPADEMSDFALTLSLDGIGGDELLWETLDPAGRMQRDPGRLDLAVDGTVRVTRAFTGLRMGEALPFEFGNISVDRAQLELLGAAADLVGDVEFLQPVNLPQGLLTLTTERILEAIDQLVAAGLIAAPHRDTVLAFASQYTRPGNDPDELISEIELGPMGASANGIPLEFLE